ncbi:MAG: hypothetical protein QNI92_06710 [Desulfobacterales bacterium]|nr:hypothetical protein [Desulfobacterales bacterium]MDJ0911969.1 hypothetical protein [Desulfobacterales bacterium]
MDGVFYTLHDFFEHTKSITYILIVLALIGIGGFWTFLSGRDDESDT